MAVSSLDSIDRRILRELQEDARIPNADLARKVARLRPMGVIKG